ncbi:murein L,D-transpeptidase catalytic domain family protein [Paenimyroides aestuarii]|uniref:Murein L,D-transpeptidase catalytic domain family protein n=1 Tax=Paenimyroides aestuarii TaxID=2968490 RepID=A0ABY5NSB6_9FLAO|nr:murein L,D-transpeptidase catalytic domain family protein [Paenimyroides aestuarii]UUV21457.1 murein L,D-transpeptidase catalytic domain family protein [Paenimyroides aestuarii]
MNFKLLPIMMVGLLSFKPMTTNPNGDNNGNGNGNGNGKKKVTVVTKSSTVKSKELAAVTKKNSKTSSESNLSTFDKMVLSEYLDLNEKNFEKPEMQSFTAAFKGYYKLKEQGKIKKEILTILDFTKSSTERRMWVIDMKNHEILYQTVVSHGRNSGKEYATDFSNTPESYKSSLGFYATAETYMGKHGLSLRLDGLEAGINSNARARDIVIHAADYANENLGKNQGYLGRSLGCPALPEEVAFKIINTIKDESCLFIFHADKKDYLTKSTLLN